LRDHWTIESHIRDGDTVFLTVTDRDTDEFIVYPEDLIGTSSASEPGNSSSRNDARNVAIGASCLPASASAFPDSTEPSLPYYTRTAATSSSDFPEKLAQVRTSSRLLRTTPSHCPVHPHAISHCESSHRDATAGAGSGGASGFGDGSGMVVYGARPRLKFM